MSQNKSILEETIDQHASETRQSIYIKRKKELNTVENLNFEAGCKYDGCATDLGCCSNEGCCNDYYHQPD